MKHDRVKPGRRVFGRMRQDFETLRRVVIAADHLVAGVDYGIEQRLIQHRFAELCAAVYHFRGCQPPEYIPPSQPVSLPDFLAPRPSEG